MANFLLTGSPTFPAGTSVGAYRRRYFAGGAPQPGEAPRGPVSEPTAEVDAHGDLLFTGLLEGERYYAGARVNGVWLWKSFQTPPGQVVVEGGGGGPDDDSALIPLTQKGAANGVGELDAAATVPLPELPSSVVLGKMAAPITLTGNFKPDLKEGRRVFPVVSTGAIAIQAPINPPTGAAIYVEVVVTGNNAITVPAVARWSGEEPPLDLSSTSAVNIVFMASYDNGSTWIGIGPTAVATVIASGAALGATSAQKTANLADLASAGEARQNLHVPELSVGVAVATSNIASLEGLGAIDSVTPSAGNFVLLTAQSEAKLNGPWEVHAGAWTRPTDFPNGAVVKGRTMAIMNGGGAGPPVNQRTLWVLSTKASITVGTDGQNWEAVRQRNPVTEIAFDTAGLTSTQITEGVGSVGGGIAIRPGLIISDDTNHILLKYSGTKWFKTAALTEIA